MREVMSQLQVPEAWARSSAPPVSPQRPGAAVDLDNLKTQWAAIDEAGQGRSAPFLSIRKAMVTRHCVIT